MWRVDEDARRMWDEHAGTFDEQPDHGLLDPGVRAAWAGVLLPALPGPPARVADLGCGTGSVALLLADAGHDVTALDFSPRMLALARRKGVRNLLRGDAANPPLLPSSFDVVFVRHLLWAMPDPAATIGGWVRLLRPAGRLVLVEGRWSTGAGIPAGRCRELVLRHRRSATLRRLRDPRLWGQDVTDERYLLTSLR
ncbi:class I SAM-dependent methyltransferase [Amycolatopsis acidiphila]|uniref:Class I SAM-dependent methyltransferase n=2 Tax=Amycolatopsis acidiphila TaxID=715473 RepID=A0A558ACU8_9PSEU|nr:class I SAM-dependent methyltransferase [Amycolatopsis acidiphila]